MCPECARTNMPGCTSMGETQDDVLRNAQEALRRS